MHQVRMVLDSLRRAMHDDEWVVLLKEKEGGRYLPVYVDSLRADTITRTLMNKPLSEAQGDSCGLPHIAAILSTAESASVIITRFENNTFYARLTINYQGKHRQIECSAGQALALGIRAEAQLFADESILDRAGVTATA